MDRKNFLLIAASLVILGAIAFYLPAQRANKSKDDTAQTKVVENPHVKIQYTDKGFNPSSVTVKVGTTVEWTSQPGVMMRVASNPHPTHLDLPGLDELKAGPDYSYTFVKVGNWGYHNHFNPVNHGVVIVK